MKLEVYKYHGAGNDFVMVNQFQKQIPLSAEQIRKICHRHFGVGADGLIEILPSQEADFTMKYYNSDGLLGSMCGNGGRCIAFFAFQLGVAKEKGIFDAFDGKHTFRILNQKKYTGLVELQMNDIQKFYAVDKGYFVNSGSPHFIRFMENLQDTDVFTEGKKIRYSESFQPDGVNVNFVCEKNGHLFVRTYERGVENETLSCGTGAVALAAAYLLKSRQQRANINIQTKGGELKVELLHNKNAFEQVKLTGPATFVFKTEIEI